MLPHCQLRPNWAVLQYPAYIYLTIGTDIMTGTYTQHWQTGSNNIGLGQIREIPPIIKTSIDFMADIITIPIPIKKYD